MPALSNASWTSAPGREQHYIGRGCYTQKCLPLCGRGVTALGREGAGAPSAATFQCGGVRVVQLAPSSTSPADEGASGKAVRLPQRPWTCAARRRESGPPCGSRRALGKARGPASGHEASCACRERPRSAAEGRRREGMEQWTPGRRSGPTREPPAGPTAAAARRNGITRSKRESGGHPWPGRRRRAG
eukprot:scaffold1318_cov388-Prasinococcus_capsulatus_cf.AAC.48